MQCFDGVSALIYVVNLSGYNSVLFEEQNKLRMLESLELFQLTIENRIFANLPCFLLFNKLDLFQCEIMKYPITKCFPEYTGDPNSYQESLKYITSQFEKCTTGKHFMHVLSACDRNLVKDVWLKIQSQLFS